MSLDVLLEPIPAKEVEPCKVGRMLADLDDPYKSALANLLNLSYANGGMSDEALAERINKAGLKVGASVINRHRRGKCHCE